MGSDSKQASLAAASSSTSTPTASPNAKRSRDPEDEVYLDNLHSHKRYLSEIMASSLNGLTVGDPLSETHLMDSPSRSESMFYVRDDISFQYSPMSEDSDDSRFCETPVTCSSQTDSLPTSPVSPYRHQRQLGAFSSAASTSLHSSHCCTINGVTPTQPRQRGSDSEGRFPSSPSDICHSADLRRAALLRSVQMRAQSPGPSSIELPFGSGQESGHSVEAEERPCDEREYQIEECSAMGISEPEFCEGKSCRVLDMNTKDDDSGG